MIKKETRGRKKLADPKVELRFWIEGSAIKANNGIESSIEKCKLTLKEFKL